MVPGSLLTAKTNRGRQKNISQVDIYFMESRKNLVFIRIFPSLLVINLPLSHAALPKNYKGKKIFYDSLFIVLNKYIVRVTTGGCLKAL